MQMVIITSWDVCSVRRPVINGGWMRFLKTTDYSGEQSEITRLGENHVFYLPYLMGERSPHNDPDARAAFIGMSMDTSREDMTLAVLEGVAFGLRDSLEVARSIGVDPQRTKICGGGAKSPLWRKIIANVMNMKVDIIESGRRTGIRRGNSCRSRMRCVSLGGRSCEEAGKSRENRRTG